MNSGKQSIIGAEWTKWDLHVHTPSSIIQHYSEIDGKDIWDSYIDDLESLPESIKVLGINDYQFLDGYKKVLEYKSKGRLQNIDLVLPVLEFRIKKFGGHKEFKRVNLHVIFSNELPVDIIQEQFLNALTAEYNLTSEYSEIGRWSGVITRSSLEDLGRRIKASIPVSELHRYGSDLEEGFNNLNIDDEVIKDKLSKSSYFDGKYLIAIGKTEWDSFSWSDSSIAEKKHVINSAHFVFTASETPANFYSAKSKLTSQKVNDLLLDCSDAHYNSLSANKDRLGNCFTWIKADRTFNGLKQIIQDTERIYIGDVPPLMEREMQNPTKFIAQLSFKKIEGVHENEVWFENLTIPLNSSLVAIIGNKGQGKSAIADTIGLLGNSKSYPDFSFITSDRFKKKKPYNLSELFEASLVWKSGVVTSKLLSEEYDSTKPETVKYIPQGFLEKLCNDDVGLFEMELKKVIFNHLPSELKNGFSSLDNLIDSQTQVLQSQIIDTQSNLDEINRKISELEYKIQPDEIKKIEEHLKIKITELDLHDQSKPTEIFPPDDPAILERNQSLSSLIESKREEANQLEIKINEARQNISDCNKKIKSVHNIIGQLELLNKKLTAVQGNLSDDLKELGLNWSELVAIKINVKVLEDLRSSLQAKLEEFKPLVEETDSLSLVSKKNRIEEEIKKLQLNLDTPSREYQKYISDLESWNRKRLTIIGSSAINESLEYYQNDLNYIQNNLESDISSLKQKRNEIVERLYDLKTSITEIYRSVFEPLTKFIHSYNETLKTHEISLDVSFRVESFLEKFFDHINLGAKGSFSGSQLGPDKLKQIIENYDFNSKEDLLKFLDEIIVNLIEDTRDGQKKEKRYIPQQLKKGYSVTDLYNHLFHLEYLIPEYKLRLGGKNIAELSPGERGALLLIFYLTLDKEDSPLIIDQPEENLDNQSVFNILVQFIVNAKNRRQIIIVTHNPNLAVVCDAEQIIHVEMDKQNGNRMTINSGAIENSKIKDAVVNILEGTYPAFDKRNWKYKTSPSSI